MDNVMKEALDVAPKSPVPASNSVSSPGVMETPPAVSLCLRAPLVLHNLLCVPMLYRIADRQVGRGGLLVWLLSHPALGVQQILRIF